MSGFFFFDAATHTYTVDEVRKKSVTEIISPLVDFSMVPESALEFARDRGTNVHKACELTDLGVLDFETLDERLQGYVMGWQKFMMEFMPTWDHIELPLYSEFYGFCGTPDRAGRVDVKEGKKITQKKIVLDIKSSAQLSPVVGVQLSGYATLLQRGISETDLKPEFEADELWAVQLKNDGTYRRKVYTPQHPVFLGLLAVSNWKERYDN